MCQIPWPFGSSASSNGTPCYSETQAYSGTSTNTKIVSILRDLYKGKSNMSLPNKTHTKVQQLYQISRSVKINVLFSSRQPFGTQTLDRPIHSLSAPDLLPANLAGMIRSLFPSVGTKSRVSGLRHFRCSLRPFVRRRDRPASAEPHGFGVPNSLECQSGGVCSSLLAVAESLFLIGEDGT